MWPISITERIARVDIDRSIFRDTPSPPRNNIVPRMKKQESEGNLRQEFVHANGWRTQPKMISFLGFLLARLLQLFREFFIPLPLSFFFLLFCERIFRLINGGMEKEGRKKKEGEKMNGMFNY